MLSRGRVALIRAAFAAVLTACALLNAASAQKNGATTTRSATPPETRIDINRASLDELLKVPGMTRSWAGRIVRFRPYRSKQDLLDHGVLPSDVYDRIKEYIIAHRKE